MGEPRKCGCLECPDLPARDPELRAGALERQLLAAAGRRSDAGSPRVRAEAGDEAPRRRRGRERRARAASSGPMPPSATRSATAGSSSLPGGRSRLVTVRAAVWMRCSSSSRRSAASASSASVGGRPRSSQSSCSARASRIACSCRCTGTRIVREELAIARVTACRIHQVAYVENLKPLRQSNFSTARIRPEHALLDQVEEGEALPAVVLCDRDDQAQVRSGSSPPWHARRRARCASPAPLPEQR